MRTPQCISVVAFAAALLISTGASAQTVGFVAGTQGTVEVQARGGTSWAASAIDQDVSIGDTIRTGPDSAVKILLADETILTLGEDTELLIDEYVVGEAATRDPSTIELFKGRARVFVGEAFGGPTRLEMYTPTAVIGVKGTGFEAFITEDRRRRKYTLVCHLHGDIFTRPREESQKSKVVIPTDELCAQVFRDHAPSDLIPRPAGFAPILGPSSSSGGDVTAAVDVVETPPVGPGPGRQPSGPTGQPGGPSDPGEVLLIEQPPVASASDPIVIFGVPGANAPQPPGPATPQGMLPGENAPQPPGPGGLPGENAPQPQN